MIHAQLRFVSHLVLWTSVAAGIFLAALGLAERTWQLGLVGVFGVVSGYTWYVWLRSHAQRGEDIQEMLQLLYNQERRQREHEQEQARRVRADAQVPRSSQAATSTSEVKPPTEKPGGAAAPGVHQTTLIREGFSRHKGTCGSCGKSLLMARIGDTCFSCGATFASEVPKKQ